MRELRYDPEANAAYVTIGRPIRAGEAVRQVPVPLPDDLPGELILDFDRDGHLLGVEILGASALLRAEDRRGQ
ncbi:DUF2283 domain-containing protein [Microbacterium sp. K2]|jgi:uncharacterized protein YuzE|uniref:DUF2283 domain-containing protein n=1 Tax=Microbacterium sp. K2 TaxID=3391827 RepID=UPI003EDB42F3